MKYLLAGLFCLLVDAALVHADHLNLAFFDVDMIDELSGALSCKYNLQQHVMVPLLFPKPRIMPCLS